MVSNYFAGSTRIDDKNKERQSELKLEDSWPTQDPYLKILIAMEGYLFVDLHAAFEYFEVFDGNKLTATSFLDRYLGVTLGAAAEHRKDLPNMVDVQGVEYFMATTKRTKEGRRGAKV